MNIVTVDTKESFEVDPLVFSSDYKGDLVHQAVVMVMNSERSGNSAQKTRAEVRGGGRKPWRQKGTGRARAGTIRSPLWRTGGVTFASKKRNYGQKINKKMYKNALCSILSELCRNDDLVVVSDFNCESPKTKHVLSKMNDMGLKNALIVLDEVGENEYLATRNLNQYAVCDITELDPVWLLRFEKVLMTQAAVKNLEERLQ